MPSFSTLQDNFNDGVLAPDWGNSYGGVTESGGLAHVPCTTGFAGYQTAYSWTLAGASFFVAVTSVPAVSTATEAYASAFVNAPSIGDSTSPLYGCRIGFVINTVTGLLRCQNDTGYFDAASVDITYDSVAHKFVRLREDGTNVYWDTSPDGSTWTNRRTLATPSWVTDSVEQCALDLSAHRDAGTNDEVTYDLFNTLSNGASITGEAGLTADSSIAAPGKLMVQAGATALTSDSTLTATASLALQGDVVLAAESNLAADPTAEGIPEVAELAAGILDLLIEQGSTFVQTWTVDDPPGFTWDGWTARSQIRSAPADSGELLLDLTAYLTVTGPDIRVVIPATETATLTRNGVWDLEMAKGSTVVRILQGKVEVSLEVTR